MFLEMPDEQATSGQSPEYKTLLAEVRELSERLKQAKADEGESRAYQAAAMVGYTEEKWQSKVSALEDFIDTWATHDNLCALRGTGNACTCGYTAARAALDSAS